MNTINYARVVLGGLLAGLVLNIGEFLPNEFVIKEDTEAALRALGLAQIGGAQIAVFVLMGFLLGIVMVWLYAAARPRLGPGVKSAVCVGVVVWTLVYFFASVSYHTMGMFPLGMLVIANAWGLVEIPLATVAGAWLYQE